MMLTKTAGLSAVKAVGVSAASLRGPFCVSALANAQQQQCRRNFAGGKASAMTTPAPPPAPATSGTPGFERDPEEMRRMSRTREESIYKLGKHRSNAMELVHKVPIIEVDGNMAICDGGGGALGHPLEYISLARPGAVEYCKYCSLRYTSKKKH